MDTTLVGALIGAVISIACVVIGWLLAGYERRQQQSQENLSLSCALLMEINAAAWHILNTREALMRSTEARRIISLDSIEYYLPTPTLFYDSAGHSIAKLDPTIAKSLVEFQTHFTRTLARTRRVCGVDGRKLRAEARLEAIKQCAEDWGYVGWAGAVCMEELLPKVSKSLTAEQRELAENYAKHLHNSSTNRWTLPDDGIAGVFDDEAGTTVITSIPNEVRKI